MPVGKLDTTEAPKNKEKVEVDEFILKATGLSKEDLEKYADKEE